MTNTPMTGQKGQIEIKQDWRWAWASFTVHGGPFPRYQPTPGHTMGVCLLEQRLPTAEVWLPIADFSVPENPDKVRDTLKLMAAAMLLGQGVYVGCMAGQGRTGLILSLFVKAMGQEYPVEYVRKHYYPHAVETKTQYAYVMEFDVTDVTRAAKAMGRKLWLQRLLGMSIPKTPSTLTKSL